MEKINISKKTERLTGIALLAAIVFVLQVVTYFIKVGQFSFSFVLVPIVIGGIFYGPVAGLVLGGVFGIATAFSCIAGLDGGGAMLLAANPVLTILLCIVKGAVAGWLSALVYSGLSAIKTNRYLSIIISAVVTPVVNTAIFCGAMLVLFKPTLSIWANGSDIITYVFLGLIGVNFIIELLLNIIFCPIITSALAKYKKV